MVGVSERGSGELFFLPQHHPSIPSVCFLLGESGLPVQLRKMVKVLETEVCPHSPTITWQVACLRHCLAITILSTSHHFSMPCLIFLSSQPFSFRTPSCCHAAIRERTKSLLLPPPPPPHVREQPGNHFPSLTNGNPTCNNGQPESPL